MDDGERKLSDVGLAKVGHHFVFFQNALDMRG